MCGLLGIGIPVVTSAAYPIQSKNNPPKKVIIIGAGAAGLTAAHLLHQAGVEVQVLEANTNYGGRMKRITEFADFPIPVGAEWLHVKRTIFDEIINDSNTKVGIQTTPYNFEEDKALLGEEKVSLKKLGFSIDQKFINSTWFDFFEQYVIPGIRSKILLNEVVKSIDYSSNQLKIQTQTASYDADKVIITVPVKLLQNDAIQFLPSLPQKKLDAIKNVTVWDGCKAFIQFSEKFYPTVIGFNTEPKTAGHKLYYDAAYGQKTAQNILGLFAVGQVSAPYLKRSGDDLINYVLAELDERFNGKASKAYIKHIFQNWTEEPYAQGAYVQYFESRNNIKKLGKSVDDKLFFAGDAYTNGFGWSSVHAAAKAAKRVVEKLI